MDRKEYTGIFDLRLRTLRECKVAGCDDIRDSLPRLLQGRKIARMRRRAGTARPTFVLLFWGDEAPGGGQGFCVLDCDGAHAIGFNHEPRRKLPARIAPNEINVAVLIEIV